MTRDETEAFLERTFRLIADARMRIIESQQKLTEAQIRAKLSRGQVIHSDSHSSGLRKSTNET